MAVNEVNTQINSLFTRLKKSFTPNKNLMDAVARYLHQSVMTNFANQSLSPIPFPKGRGGNIFGRNWEPLKASTLGQKRRRGLSDRILEATGNLKRSIKTSSTNSNAWIYTDAVYGAIHNFGGIISLPGRSGQFRVNKKRVTGIGFKEKIIKIPARPFLILTEGFKERILEEIRMQVGSLQSR